MKHLPKTLVSLGIPVRSREVLSRSYHYTDKLKTIYLRTNPITEPEGEQLCITIVPPFLCTWEQCAKIMNMCRLINIGSDYLTNLSCSVKSIYMITFEERLLFCLRVKKKQGTRETYEFIETMRDIRRDLIRLGVTFQSGPLEYKTLHIKLFSIPKVKRNPLLLHKSVISVVEASRKELPLCFTGGKIILYQENERGILTPCNPITTY